MNEILLHPRLKHQLAKDFKTTKQTVDMSLKYFNNSEMAIGIRSKALELLVKESKKPLSYVNERNE